jgi:beta-N-acetylhexosaminidase
MSTQKNVIFGLASTSISEQERQFFREVQPLGFILFARNIQNFKQTQALVSELKSLIDSDYVPILIDQEGGRVRRLKPPYFRDSKAAGDFGKLAEKNMDDAQLAVFLNHYLMGKELASLGFNIDCAPVLDLVHGGAHNIIGDRSFGSDPLQVTNLGKYAIYGLMAAGVLPIVKHIPGHGRAKLDSHHDLPIIDTPLAILEKTDFLPFKELAFAPLAMTAHLILKDIDPDKPVTLSQPSINYIRDEIGFKNILITDAIEMKALSGSFASRAKEALIAGCDILLHCSAKMDEMQQVIDQTTVVNHTTWEILTQHLDKCYVSDELGSNYSKYLTCEVEDLEKELSALML